MTSALLGKSISLLTELIGFDTTSRESNLALIDFIERYLHTRGIACERIYNAEQSKTNLWATIGSAEQPGLVLSGHTDVVPVDGQSWSSDPFQAEVRDGKLYGRGSCDMKGFIACCLAMVDIFQTTTLDIPIHFAFSYDEEIGCVGVRGLLEALEQRPVRPLACWVGEPTEMGIIRAHKGMDARRCQITGCAGHSSLPDHGVNAIYQAAKLINKITEIDAEIKQKGPFDPRFEPPYSTVHVGTIHGGTALNIIPEHCEFDLNIRNLPHDNPSRHFDALKHYADATLLPPMQAVHADSSIRWQRIAHYPGLDTDDAHPLVSWLEALNPAGTSGEAVSYGTEAGLFSEMGIPALICGPGSIEQAHRPDEFVDIAQLDACLDMLAQVPDALAELVSTA